MLIDSFGRPLTYLRMAITDRCNLRCHYCMPLKGLNWIPRKELLTADEIVKIAQIFAFLGVTKIRFTGGEPTLRNDFNDVVQEIKRLQIFKSMHLTTNATHFIAHQNSDNALLWSSVNVSLDSLDAANFARITGRDEWHAVMKNLKTLLSFGAHVRVNVVVMNGKNDHEILPFVQWAMTEKIDIRFIEEMPFNGHQKKEQPFWTADRIVDHIRTQFAIEPMPDVFGETARYYKAADMLGRVGVIAAYSRSFCGSCNRIRITPLGVMRTCLYSEGGLQLRDALRNGWTDDQIINAIKTAVNGKAKNGWEAERLRETNATESMAIIGG